MCSFIICGVVRNGGLELSRTLTRIREFSLMVDDVFLVIATNDNTDSTLDILHEFKNNTHRKIKVKIINIDGMVRSIPNRIERISAARNFCIQYISRNLCADDYPFTYIMDLDGPNVDCDLEWFLINYSSLPKDWVGMFPTQRDGYYDLLALRRTGWIEGDVSDSIQRRVARNFLVPLSRRRKIQQATRLEVYEKQFRIPEEKLFIPVWSAFGGMGLYKSNVVFDNYYHHSDKRGRRVCEHVVFNSNIVLNGGHLYIASDWINIAPSEHLGNGSGKDMPKDMLLDVY